MKKRMLLLVVLILIFSLSPLNFITAMAYDIIETDYISIIKQYVGTSNPEEIYYTLCDIDYNGVSELLVGYGGSDGLDIYGKDSNGIIDYHETIRNIRGIYLYNDSIYIVDCALEDVSVNYVKNDIALIRLDLYNNKIYQQILYDKMYDVDMSKIDTNWEMDIAPIAEIIRSGKEIEIYRASELSLLENKDISVVLNGSKLTFDQPPVMENDRILVPIRSIAEAMGDDVDWNPETQTAFIRHPDRTLIIPLNESHLNIEKSDTKREIVPLDVPSQERNGRTLVPVRAFCESLGADVTWDSTSNTAYITYKSNAI